MEASRENLRDEIVFLLNASRELSPSEDQALADTFLSHWDRMPSRRGRARRRSRLVPTSATALAILLAIPVVLVIQTYSKLDGYLPRPDAGALPLVYWIALVAMILVLAAAVVSERTGWRLRVTAIRD